MLIFDAHLDLAWNALDWNRDLLLPVSEIRKRECELGMTGKGRGEGTVSFPELRRGGVGLFIATLLARLLAAQPDAGHPALRAHGSGLRRGVRTDGVLLCPGAARRAALDQGCVDPGCSRPRLECRSGARAAGFHSEHGRGRSGAVAGTGGEWFQAGLRIIGPAHYGVSPYAHGTGTEGGLFAKGPALLKEMQRVGMILDVTHLSDQCFDEALDIYGGPVLASHHNCRALVPDQRQLTDAQIKRLIERGAVIGTALDAWMMVPGWVRGQTRPEEAGVKLETMVDHIDHVCQLAGNARHAAIGTDLDGGFGREQSPYDLDTIADLRRLPELLRRRGYDDDAIAGILHGNWLRFFRQALPQAA